MASSQPADNSSELSGGMTRLVFGNAWQWATSAEQGEEMPETLFKLFDTILRKSAHFTAFLILGICIVNTVRQMTNKQTRVFLISICWCSSYGALDELHQYFVPGRACMWQDWLIDTSGAMLGVFITLAIIKHRNNRQVIV